MGLLSLILLLVLVLSACGASSLEHMRVSGALSNGEVILGESTSDPSDPAQTGIPGTGSNPGAVDTEQTKGTGSSSPAAIAVTSQVPAMQPGSSADMQPTPLPEAPATPETMQGSANAGIIVRSENILSTREKEALLNELEKELNGLFGAIDQVSTEQQAGQAE